MTFLVKLFSFVLLATVCVVGSVIISPFSAIAYAFRETFLESNGKLVKKEGKKDGF